MFSASGLARGLALNANDLLCALGETLRDGEALSWRELGCSAPTGEANDHHLLSESAVHRLMYGASGLSHCDLSFVVWFYEWLLPKLRARVI